MKFLVGLALALVFISQIPGKTTVYAYEPQTPQEWITYWAKKYNVSAQDMLAVARCESNFRPEAINPTDGIGGSYGLFQYQKSTWKNFSSSLGEELDIWSAYDQSKLTAYAFSKGLQNHWSCFAKIK